MRPYKLKLAKKLHGIMSPSMESTANRLEDHWPQAKERILKEWDLLTESDLDRSSRQYDKIVSLIRRRYGGRVEIIQEAAIRDALNRLLASLEE